MLFGSDCSLPGGRSKWCLFSSEVWSQSWRDWDRRTGKPLGNNHINKVEACKTAQAKRSQLLQETLTQTFPFFYYYVLIHWILVWCWPKKRWVVTSIRIKSCLIIPSHRFIWSRGSMHLTSFVELIWIQQIARIIQAKLLNTWLRFMSCQNGLKISVWLKFSWSSLY